MKNEIILFEEQNVKLEVNIKDETVWLNTNQMAELFGRDFKTINKHINKIFKLLFYFRPLKCRFNCVLNIIFCIFGCN